MLNIIIIKGNPYDNVRNSLELGLGSYTDAAELYGLRLELHTINETEFVIKADNKLPNEFFSYLVNYLTYPEGLEGRMNPIGYTEIRDEKIFPKEFIGSRIMLFIPQNDKEYDNVYWVTEQNKVYKTDFGYKTKLVDVAITFEERVIDLSVSLNPDQFRIDPSDPF